MVFSSLFFMFLFLPVVLGVYYAVPKAGKNLVLLLASIFFYAWGEPIYIILMLFSAVFNYFMGLELERLSGDKRLRKINLIFTLVINLLILGFFKYYGFLLDTINGIFPVSISYRKLALPIGISFYTFQTMSYIMDVYWKKISVQKNFIKFALYITMFPQLIAGPIVRYIDIEQELSERSVTLYSFGRGAENFIKGLAKKVLIANAVGAIYTNIQSLGSEATVVSAWLGILAYTLQIYFDFSGYSDMAIGLGKMLGFHFMKNFDYPYISKSITEFWRRWHISLSTWFKEYVYIPLGGNRVSAGRHVRNIMVVWMLTGLWHGASWNFVFWGLYYGLLLILEKYILAKKLEKLHPVIRSIYTMVLVMIGWVFFSAPDMSSALKYLGMMFGIGTAGFINGAALYYLKTGFILLAAGIICARPWAYQWFKRVTRQTPVRAVVINMILLLLCIATLVYDSYNPFLYFRF